MPNSKGKMLGELGYSVVPICPYNVDVWSWRKTDAGQWEKFKLSHAPGKSPGHYDGRMWRPRKDWRTPAPWSVAFDKWGAGVGVLCGGEHNLIGLDFDITSSDATSHIRQKLAEKFGILPVRVGQPPKFLVPARCEEPISKLFSNEYVLPGHEQKMRLEVLAEGQQFVAYGTHPKTEMPYRWYGPELATVTIADLRVFTIAELGGIIKFVENVLEAFGAEQTASGGSEKGGNFKVDRKKLYAEEPEDVIACLRLIPVETSDRNYRLGIAQNIVGALGNTDLAKELWFEWCSGFPGWCPDDGEVVWDFVIKTDRRSGINALLQKAEPYAEAIMREGYKNA